MYLVSCTANIKCICTYPHCIATLQQVYRVGSERIRDDERRSWILGYGAFFRMILIVDSCGYRGGVIRQASIPCCIARYPLNIKVGIRPEFSYHSCNTYHTLHVRYTSVTRPRQPLRAILGDTLPIRARYTVPYQSACITSDTRRYEPIQGHTPETSDTLRYNNPPL